jgi:uncharacterized protein YjbI with pentapeptide repeats/class 3 adenylate cyclase
MISVSSFSFGAQFLSTDLRGASLKGCNFERARLIATKLERSDLSGAHLQSANILSVSTRGANLSGIDFTGHDLGAFDLRGVKLCSALLRGQDLSGIDFSGLDLSESDLRETNLRASTFNECQLAGVNFEGASLLGAQFRKANLSRAQLRGLDASSIDFSDANLTDADLREARLLGAQLRGACLTGAKLWKVESAGWDISGVECEYAFWSKLEAEKSRYQKREFERLFTQATTIDLKYPRRLSTAEMTTLPILLEHLQALHWGVILRLKSITDVAGGSLVSLVMEECGGLNPSDVRDDLAREAQRIQAAQLAMRDDVKMQYQMKEELAHIKEKFWPRLLELAAEHESEQSRQLTVVLMDIKDFSSWEQDELSERLALFRGLLKPILNKWQASYPNMEGDSLRVTFRNASAALACACMMEGVLDAAGFEVRIGVELGEVSVIMNEVTEVSDLEGTAVNMAARLEAAAQPGEVLVTERVRYYTEHKGMFNFEPAKVKLTKNVGTLKRGEELDCYRVTLAGPILQLA